MALYPLQEGNNMKMLGTVEVSTNRRITVPEKVMAALNIEEGDYILFIQEKDTVSLKAMKG